VVGLDRLFSGDWLHALMSMVDSIMAVVLLIVSPGSDLMSDDAELLVV